MAPARRLYHPVHGVWDHSPAGYITDYCIFILGIACCLAAMALRRKVEDDVYRRALIVFTSGMALTSTSYGIGGIAHQIMDTNHTAFGQGWGDDASAWMIPWTVSLLLGGPGFSVFVATPFACAGNRGLLLWVQYAFLAVGLLVAVYEFSLMVREKSLSSSTTTGMLMLAESLIGACASLVFVILKGPQIGYAVQMLAFIVIVMAKLLVLIRPEACSSHHAHPDCPFSPNFNHNAVYHIIIMVGQFLACTGVMLTVWPAKDNGGSSADPEAATMGAES